MTNEQHRAEARVVFIAVALAGIALLAACGQTRPPAGDADRIADEQLITMTRDHLAAFGTGRLP